MAEVFTAEDVQRLGMSPEMIGTPKEPTFVPADPQAVTIDTLPPQMVYQDPEAGAIPRQTGLTPNYPLRTVASGPATPAPAAAGILPPPTQPARSDDMFGNLSKQQRMMLAFSAISDAGMAAQGKQGTSFTDTLKAFGSMADTQRKRDAAAQRQQMLQQVMGGGAAVGGSIADMNVEQLMQRQQALANYAITNPSMAQGIAPTMDIIEARIAQLKETGSAATLGSLGLDAIKKLIDSPDIGQITGTSAVINSLLERFNLAPRYSDLMSFVDQLAGINFMEAYVQLKGGGQITEIESEKATAARTRLDRALKGTPEDLKVALLELEGLFKEALSKNPSRTEGGGINEEDRRFFEEAE
jgi:hypothetical protein